MRDITKQRYGNQEVRGNVQADIDYEDYTIFHKTHFDVSVLIPCIL
jgi:hypothetical protein